VAERKAWSDQDRLQALALYCRLSFGQLHRERPEVISAKLAGSLDFMSRYQASSAEAAWGHFCLASQMRFWVMTCMASALSHFAI